MRSVSPSGRTPHLGATATYALPPSHLSKRLRPRSTHPRAARARAGARTSASPAQRLAGPARRPSPTPTPVISSCEDPDLCARPRYVGVGPGAEALKSLRAHAPSTPSSISPCFGAPSRRYCASSAETPTVLAQIRSDIAPHAPAGACDAAAPKGDLPTSSAQSPPRARVRVGSWRLASCRCRQDGVSDAQ